MIPIVGNSYNDTLKSKLVCSDRWFYEIKYKEEYFDYRKVERQQATERESPDKRAIDNSPW